MNNFIWQNVVKGSRLSVIQFIVFVVVISVTMKDISGHMQQNLHKNQCKASKEYI